MTTTTLEICCADIGSVAAAVAGGASRIELCTALEVGGLTPSPGLITEARKMTAGKCKLNVLIRQRPGDYLYTPDEVAVMMADIDFCGRAGCDGVVVGALTTDGRVDEAVTRALISAAAPYPSMSNTFHRAFDLCRDPFEALDTISAIVIDRILSSGLAPSAPEGLEMLVKLVEYADGRVSIMPGAGVNSRNVADIISATGAREIHASAKTRVGSDMQFRRGDVSMGAPGADEYSRFTTSTQEVAAIVNALSAL